MPEDWEEQPLRHFLGDIRQIALVCSDEELEMRLRRRAWMDEPERASLLALNRRIRSRTDVTLVDTSIRPATVVADEIAAIVTVADR